MLACLHKPRPTDWTVKMHLVTGQPAPASEPPFDPAVAAAEALEKAGIVAARLLTTKWVKEVWAFGSIARGHIEPASQYTSDCDLILVVDEWRYWWMMEYLYGHHPEYVMKTHRYHAAMFELELGQTVRGHGFWGGLDLIVVPEGWLDRLAELQEKGRHDDRFFMQKISRDARRFDPESRTFLPPQR